MHVCDRNNNTLRLFSACDLKSLRCIFIYLWNGLLKIGIEIDGTTAYKLRNRYHSSCKAAGLTPSSLTLLQGTTKKPDYGDTRLQIMRCRGFCCVKKIDCAACADDSVWSMCDR